LTKTPPPWTNEHTQLIKQIKLYAKEIPCLHIASPSTFKIIETDASDIGYGGILKKLINNKEQLVQYTSGTWNNAQRNYATARKEIQIEIKENFIICTICHLIKLNNCK
ncbi:hypothetical protein CFOL_v3_07907, partial [Cephalotus follicularis]